MIPLVVGLGFVITWLLLPKGGDKTAVVVPTPFNTPIGITTGFGSPSIAGNIHADENKTQQNQPSASSSGVPAYSLQTQEFNTAPSRPIATFAGVPQFYNKEQHQLSFPASRARTAPEESSCGCGDKSKASSNCSTMKRRTADAGCLTTSRRKQIAQTPPHLVDSWADNVLSSHWSAYDAVANELYNIQKDNPQGHDLTIPAGVSLTHIGLTSKGY